MKTGRNDPCPCGSGKKYKNCCLNKALIPSDVPKNIPKISISSFKNMQGAQCTGCGETYMRSRSEGKWKYYFATTSYIPGSRKVYRHNLYLAPIEYLNQPHHNLPLLFEGKNNLLQ